MFYRFLNSTVLNGQSTPIDLRDRRNIISPRQHRSCRIAKQMGKCLTLSQKWPEMTKIYNNHYIYKNVQISANYNASTEKTTTEFLSGPVKTKAVEKRKARAIFEKKSFIWCLLQLAIFFSFTIYSIQKGHWLFRRIRDRKCMVDEQDHHQKSSNNKKLTQIYKFRRRA